MWSFGNGIPHSLQAGPKGAQYLLVFDDGDFDASGTTFMVGSPFDILILHLIRIFSLTIGLLILHVMFWQKTLGGTPLFSTTFQRKILI